MNSGPTIMIVFCLIFTMYIRVLFKRHAPKNTTTKNTGEILFYSQNRETTKVVSLYLDGFSALVSVKFSWSKQQVFQHLKEVTTGITLQILH